MSGVLGTPCSAGLCPPPTPRLRLCGPHLRCGFRTYQPQATQPQEPPAFRALGWTEVGTPSAPAPLWTSGRWVTPGMVILGLGSSEALGKGARKGLLGGETGRKLSFTEYPFYVRPLCSELSLQSFGARVGNRRLKIIKVRGTWGPQWLSV